MVSHLHKPTTIFVRTTNERKEFVRREAEKLGISMGSWAECRMFDIPFEHISGKVKATSTRKPQKQQP